MKKRLEERQCGEMRILNANASTEEVKKKPLREACHDIREILSKNKDFNE